MQDTPELYSEIIPAMPLGPKIYFILAAPVVGAIIAALVLLPLFLQFSVKLVTHFRLGFKEAFFINLKVLAVSFLEMIVIAITIWLSGAVEDAALAIDGYGFLDPVSRLLLTSIVLLDIWLYARLIRLPEFGPIGIWRGALVLLTQILIGLAFVFGLMMLRRLATLILGALSLALLMFG